jgi:DNA (cytosine-5)-methyltransferase 1
VQGFPDGWTEGFSDTVRYRMLGNAVCVNVAEWIARRMAATMDSHNTTGKEI